MKFNKNPLMWAVVIVAIVFGVYRLVLSAQEDGSPRFTLVAVLIAVVIVFVALGIVKMQSDKQFAAVTQARPQSLVIPVTATNTAAAYHKGLGRLLGQRVKGSGNSHVVSVDRESVTVWHGGATPKQTVSLPSQLIANLVVTELLEGVRRFPAVIVTEPQGGGIVIAPMLRDGQSIDQVAQRISQTLSIPQNRILHH